MVKISNPNHPITKGMTDYQTDDELFWDTKEGNKTIVPVATAESNVHHQDFPMAFTLLYTSGRVFTTTMGHDVRALQIPGTTQLIQRGAAWVAKLVN
jgi:type 1 glutamine amidotransferase